METATHHIVSILRAHVGRDNAITASGISAKLAEGGIALCERSVRELISEAELREDWPLQLGADPGVGAGYYIATEVEDGLRRRASVSGQIEKLGMKLSAIDRQWQRIGIDLKQLGKAVAV